MARLVLALVADFAPAPDAELEGVEGVTMKCTTLSNAFTMRTPMENATSPATWLISRPDSVSVHPSKPYNGFLFPLLLTHQSLWPHSFAQPPTPSHDLPIAHQSSSSQYG